MTRQNISIHGIYFDAQDRVLLIKDSHSSQWGFPGGGVEEGETHNDTLRREFLEETGMNVLGSLPYITRQDDGMKQRYFYKVEKAEGQLSTAGNDSDIESAAYFDISGLPVPNLAPGVEAIVKHCQHNQ